MKSEGKFYISCRKINTGFSNVRQYSVFHEGKTSQMFSNYKYEKLPCFIWPCWDMWQIFFFNFLSKNLHPDFHNSNIKNSTLFCRKFCVHTFSYDVQRILYFKLKIRSPDLYMWIIENFMFHILKSASRVWHVKHNFIFYVGHSHFKCLYLKNR